MVRWLCPWTAVPGVILPLFWQKYGRTSIYFQPLFAIFFRYLSYFGGIYNIYAIFSSNIATWRCTNIIHQINAKCRRFDVFYYEFGNISVILCQTSSKETAYLHNERAIYPHCYYAIFTKWKIWNKNLQKSVDKPTLHGYNNTCKQRSYTDRKVRAALFVLKVGLQKSRQWCRCDFCASTYSGLAAVRK